MVLLDGRPHDWLEGPWPAPHRAWVSGRRPQHIIEAHLLPAEATAGYFHLLRGLLRNCGVRGAFDGGRLGIFVRNDGHWLVEEQLAGKREATRLGRVLEPPGVTYTTANAPQATGRVG